MAMIWIFSEDVNSAMYVTKIAYETSKALGSGISLITINASSESLSELRGFEEVIILRESEKLGSYDHAVALSELIKTHNPKIVIMPATKTCREVAAITAVLTNSAYAAEVSEIFFDTSKQEIRYSRAILGGIVSAEYKVTAGTLIATHKSFIPHRLEGDRPKIVEVEVRRRESRIKRVRLEHVKRAGIDLTKAKRIVTVGRGLKKKEDLEMIRELAHLLNGEIGGTRVITEDYGWLPKEHQVGLSGVIVAPDLYIAIGVSGQVQHVIGFKDARIVVSINKDKDAPIHQVADYVIVGDLYEIVPALIQKLKEASRPAT